MLVLCTIDQLDKWIAIYAHTQKFFYQEPSTGLGPTKYNIGFEEDKFSAVSAFTIFSVYKQTIIIILVQVKQMRGE